MTARPKLDWTQRIQVALWLSCLRIAFDDADAVTLDMLRPPSRRKLGTREHRRLYREARAQILQAIEYATPDVPEPEPERGDPAGSGGAGGE